MGSLPEGEKAVCSGASFITHLFNAMLPVNHIIPLFFSSSSILLVLVVLELTLNVTISFIIAIPVWSDCWLLQKFLPTASFITGSSLMEFIRIRLPSALPIKHILTVFILKWLPVQSIQPIKNLNVEVESKINFDNLKLTLGISPVLGLLEFWVLILLYGLAIDRYCFGDGCNVCSRIRSWPLFTRITRCWRYGTLCLYLRNDHSSWKYWHDG